MKIKSKHMQCLEWKCEREENVDCSIAVGCVAVAALAGLGAVGKLVTRHLPTGTAAFAMVLVLLGLGPYPLLRNFMIFGGSARFRFEFELVCPSTASIGCLRGCFCCCCCFGCCSLRDKRCSCKSSSRNAAHAPRYNEREWGKKTKQNKNNNRNNVKQTEVRHKKKKKINKHLRIYNTNAGQNTQIHLLLFHLLSLTEKVQAIACHGKIGLHFVV